MGAGTKQNKAVINRIIQARIDELDADKDLPVGHPEKMTRGQREKIWRTIERLELSKKIHRPTPGANKVKASPNGKTLVHRGPGRPRVINSPEVVEITPVEEVKPDPKATEFLDKLQQAAGGSD